MPILIPSATQGPDTGSKQRADERARHTPRGPGSKRALVTLACASDIPVWSCGSLKNILSSAPPPMLPRGDDACLNDTRRELSSEVSAMQTRTPINPGVMSPPPGEASTPPSRDKRRYASEEKEAIFWKRRKYEKLEGLYRCRCASSQNS
ncbi:hypothetical protein C8Q78DRAFT_714326 [Trametes maxima]|nr:hypothetical protein C8Q78DRAFT_714326 [Trametes maxima]